MLEKDIAVPQRGVEFGPPVRSGRVIQASAATVWKVLSTPGQLARYHPYCHSNRVMQWPGVGSRDGVRYHSGLYFERDFISWREGAGFDVRVGPPPRKTCEVAWNISAITPDSCVVDITVTPILEARLREDVKRAFVQTYFGDSIYLYLDHLFRGLDQFITTGRDVRPTQYGPHPIYAPEVR